VVGIGTDEGMVGENISGATAFTFVDGVIRMLSASDAATLIVGVVIVMLGDIIRGVTVVTGVKSHATLIVGVVIVLLGDIIRGVTVVTGVKVTVTVDGSLLITTTGDSLLTSA